MSAKLFVIAICAAIGFAGGMLVYRSYRRVADYYTSLCDMITVLKRNISYRKDGAASVLSGYTASCPLLAKNIKEYVDFAVGKGDMPKLTRGYLDDAQFERISAFFAALGGGDNIQQSAELDAGLSEFSECKTEAEKLCKTRGNAAIKLGLLFGLGVGILVL